MTSINIDQVNDLEMTFAELKEGGWVIPAWLRVLRKQVQFNAIKNNLCTFAGPQVIMTHHQPKDTMQNVQALVARMTEVEKMKIRSSTVDGLDRLYHHVYINELSGGPLKGGTQEQGLSEMAEVSSILSANFAEDSKNPGFGMTWRF